MSPDPDSLAHGKTREELSENIVELNEKLDAIAAQVQVLYDDLNQ